MVRVVTDSNTMIPAALAEAVGLIVVPLTVTIGGDELVEDGALDVAAAYRRLRAGEPATTSAPAPGLFATAYAECGDAPIVSVHIGAAYSGTINAAQLGATVVGADVRVVDTGTASFLAGCCALAAAEAAQTGADVDAVVAAAERVAAGVASVFTIAELDRAASGGRLGVQDVATSGTPVVAMSASSIAPVATVHSADEAAAFMLGHVAAIEGPLRIGVGDADAGPAVDDLEAQLRAALPDADVIRYVVGPTVAAHAGMGTFGVVYHRR